MKQLSEHIIETLNLNSLSEALKISSKSKVSKNLDNSKLTLEHFGQFLDMCEYVQNDKELNEKINYIHVQTGKYKQNLNTLIEYHVKHNIIRYKRYQNSPISKNDINLKEFKDNLSVSNSKNNIQLYYEDYPINYEEGNKLFFLDKDFDNIIINICLEDWDDNFDIKTTETLPKIIDENKIFKHQYGMFPLLYKIDENDYMKLFNYIKNL